MKQSQPSEVMLTARQVAGFLQVHISTIRRWSDKGMLRSYRVGLRRDRRYKQEDVLDFLHEDHIEGDRERILGQAEHRQTDQYQGITLNSGENDGGTDEGITY